MPRLLLFCCTPFCVLYTLSQLKTLVSISEAARISHRPRRAIHRLLAAGQLKRRGTARKCIDVAALGALPAQRGRKMGTCLARIRGEGYDASRVLRFLNHAAGGGADADLLLHAGRFLLAGNRDFLAALDAPPIRLLDSPEKFPDLEAYPVLPFPAFVAWRIRCLAARYTGAPAPADTAKAWRVFWRVVCSAPFDVFPRLRPAGLILAPRWTDTFFPVNPGDKAGAVSFFKPRIRFTTGETEALKTVAALFPGVRYGETIATGWRARRESVVIRRKVKGQGVAFTADAEPVPVLLIQAVEAARHGDRGKAMDLLCGLNVPQVTAGNLYRAIRRLEGAFRLSAEGGGLRGHATNPTASKAAVSSALNVTRVTLSQWTTPPATRRG